MPIYFYRYFLLFISLLYFWNNATSNVMFKYLSSKCSIFMWNHFLQFSFFFLFSDKLIFKLIWLDFSLHSSAMASSSPRRIMYFMGNVSQYKVQGYMDYHRRLLRVKLQWGLLQKLALPIQPDSKWLRLCGPCGNSYSALPVEGGSSDEQHVHDGHVCFSKTLTLKLGTSRKFHMP